MLRGLALSVLTVSAFACDFAYPIWIPRDLTADPLYRFDKKGKAGYIDSTGHIVIPPNLALLGNYASEFHDGLLEIGVSDGIYVDRTGKVVLDKKLFRGWDFSEGLAVAMRKGEHLWGYINTKGEFAIPPQFASSQNDYVYPFSDGLAMIEVHGRFGYIDKSGKFAIPTQFLDGAGFADGMARIVTEGPCSYFREGGCGFANPVFPGALPRGEYDPLGQARANYPPCKFTFTDREGQALPQRFDYARDFSEDLAPVRMGDTWGYIDKQGAMAIAPKFEDAEAFHEGLARIKARGLYGYTDKSGKIVISPQFKDAGNFGDGLAPVGDGINRFWYIDQQGRRAFDGDYSVATTFFKGLAHVGLRSRSVKFAYIDTRGRRVFTY